METVGAREDPANVCCVNVSNGISVNFSGKLKEKDSVQKRDDHPGGTEKKNKTLTEKCLLGFNKVKQGSVSFEKPLI